MRKVFFYLLMGVGLLYTQAILSIFTIDEGIYEVDSL